jgi:hypothetical protein
VNAPGVEACDLLDARLCDPRCLLAMDTPPGTACACRCGGRWHAALVFATVNEQPWVCPACAGVPEDCVRRGRCCPECGHRDGALRSAREFLRAAS